MNVFLLLFFTVDTLPPLFNAKPASVLNVHINQSWSSKYLDNSSRPNKAKRYHFPTLIVDQRHEEFFDDARNL